MCTVENPLDTVRCGVCELDLQAVIQLILHKAEHAGPKGGIACELCGTRFTRRKTLLDHYRLRHRITANFGDSKERDHKVKVLAECKQSDDLTEKKFMRRSGRKRKQETGLSFEEKGQDTSLRYKRKKENKLEQDVYEKSDGPESYNIETKSGTCLQVKDLKKSELSTVNAEALKNNAAHLQDVSKQSTESESICSNITLQESTVDVSLGKDAGDSSKEKDRTGEKKEDDIEIDKNNVGVSDGAVDLSEGAVDVHEGALEGAIGVSKGAFLSTRDSKCYSEENTSHASSTNTDSHIHVGVLNNKTEQNNTSIMQGCDESQIGDVCKKVMSDTECTELNENSSVISNKIEDNNISEKTILNDIPESQMQTPESQMQTPCSSNNPHVTVVTKIFKGTSFEYGKDVYICKECGFSCHCPVEVRKHLHYNHPHLTDSQESEDIQSPENDQEELSIQQATVNSEVTVANQGNSPRIRKVEKQDIIGHYACNKCKKEFTRLRYLRKHLQTHKTEQDYLCDECGKHFKTKTYLTAHRKTHNKRAFVCTQCNFTSENAFAIHTHRQIHNNGSIICEVCGYAYSDKSTLVKHKRVHDMSRPFPCSYPGCTWRFQNESACLAHLRGHSTVEGKFKCSKCGYAFRHKHHLKRHESKIHGLHPGKAAPAEVNNEVIASSDTISKGQDVVVNDSTVRLLLDTADGETDIGHALQPGNIVITTDTDGNPVNYHVTDIEISDGCETVLEPDKNVTVALCVQTPQEDSQSHYVPLNISLTEELLTDINSAESINTEIHTQISETRTQVSDINQ